MSALAAIHVAKKQLGLDEDTYRSMLARVTGKSSAKDMSETERLRVVEAFRKQGFKPVSKGGRKPLEGRYAKKLQALWIAAWNLGLIDNGDDRALIAFVKRQTGIDHARFLIDALEADKVIEALKGWMAREAGVDWSVGQHIYTWQRMPGAKIALAQWKLLIKAGKVEATNAAFRDFCADHCFNALPQMTAREWAGVMNRLGERIRKAR